MGSSAERYSVWPLYFLILISVHSLMNDSYTETTYESCGTAPYLTIPYYETNLKILLDEMAENVSVSPRFFVASNYAGNNVTVYGLAQCQANLQPSECKQCVSWAAKNVLDTCKATFALIEFRGCYLRYDQEQWYFLPNAPKGYQIVCNSQNSSDASFILALRQIISNVTTIASDSTGFANASYELPHVHLYALAQCVISTSAKDSGRCKSCFSSAQKGLMLCGGKSIGARSIIAAECFIRYEVYNFFGTVSTSPSAISFSGRTHRSEIAMILAWLAASAVVCGILVAIYWLVIRGFTCEWSVVFRRKGDAINNILSKTKLDRNLYFNYKVLRTATAKFQATNLLGKGSFGIVYKGILRNGTEVAVKKLFSGSGREETDFLNEVHVISVLQHRNLVKLLGCSVDGPERLLVYEYLPNRSLDQILFDKERSQLLDWERRMEIILGIARGLAYLHEESENRIIHRDIKACNILLDENFRPKIADFGLAKLIAEDESHISTRIAGTPGYIAPEYALNGQLTEKADIFSFGVVCLEIMTGKRCTSIFSTEEDMRIQSFLEKIWTEYTSGKVLSAMDSNLEGKYLAEEAVQVFHVALVCTQSSAALRRRMSEVVFMLTSNQREELPSPTQPEFIHLDDHDDDNASLFRSFHLRSQTFQSTSTLGTDRC